MKLLTKQVNAYSVPRLVIMNNKTIVIELDKKNIGTCSTGENNNGID